MKEDKFDEVIEQSLNQAREVLIIKGKEYRRNQNAMHNFDISVQQSTTGETREDVIWSMARKHFISIQDIRTDIREGNLPSRDLVDEKYGDLINYLLLEKASIIDKLDKVKLPF